MTNLYSSLMGGILCIDSQVHWVPLIFCWIMFLLMIYVCCIWRLSPVLCAYPWGFTVLTEDVKGSFDSMNTKEWFFQLKINK